MAPVSTFILRDNFPDPCPSSLLPEVSQFSSSIYIPGTFWAVAPVLDLRMSLWVRQSVCRLFKSNTLISRSPLSSLDKIPTVFTNRYYEDSSSWNYCPSLMSSMWGWTPCSSGIISASKIFLPFINGHINGVRLVYISTSPTSLNVASSYIPSYRNSVQLVFKWFSWRLFYKLVVILM